MSEFSAAPRQVPIALGLGLGLGVVSAFVLGLLSASAEPGDGGMDQLVRLSLLRSGTHYAMLALALAGALDLYRRTSGTARLGARVTLVGVVVLIAIAVFQVYFRQVYAPTSADPAKWETLRAILTWAWRGSVVAWVALSGGLIVAGWHAPRVRLLAAPLVVATLLANPFDFYANYIFELFGEGRYRSVIVSGLLDAAVAGLAIAVMVASAPLRDAGGNYHRTAAALDRTASSLYARLWIAVASALLVLLMFGSRGGGETLAKLLGVGVPFANAVAGIVMITGVLGAAGSAGPRAPRLQLYASGAALTVTVSITSIQVLALLKLVFGEPGSMSMGSEIAQAMPLLMPAIGLVALVLLGWGLHDIACALDAPALTKRAASSIGILVACQLFVIGIPYMVATTKSRDASTVVLGMLAAAVAAVISLVTLARLCRATATELRTRHEPPAATVIG